MLKWFRRRDTKTDASHEVTDTARNLPAAAPVPATRDADAPANGPARASYTEAEARDVVGDRLHALLSELPAPMRKTDAPAVLGALAESMDTSIGQPPAAAQKALAVSRNPNSSVGQMVDLFGQDPGLTQELLRYANSSYYSTAGGSVQSLQMGVQRIGSTGVENVLLSSTVRGALCRPGGMYDALVDQVWSHVVRCGPIARGIAPAFGVDPERAFALALLHDAGKLILFEHISNFRRTHRRDVNIPNHLLLWALKRLHEPMGGLAALRWGLPEDSALAISRHHRTPAPADVDPLSEVIYVAERLDLDTIRRTPPDLEAYWREGALTGPLADVQAILAEDDEERRAA